MRKIKVLHFITSIDNRSGGTTTFLKLLTESISKDVDVTIVTGKTPNPVPISGATIKFFDLSLTNLLKFRSFIKAFIQQEKPDLLHVNGIWEPSNSLIQRVAQKMDIPVIVSPHGMLEPWIISKNKLKKKVAMLLYQHKSLNNASCLHASVPSEKENIKALGYTGNIVVTGNGIQTDHLSSKTSWKRTKKILFLSRINPKKGIEFLIDAIASLKKEFSGHSIIIIGEGDPQYINSLKQKAKLAGVEELFIFHEAVYGDKKWELYRQADLFVLPTHSENFGLVVPEALACGTPVITTIGAPWKDLEEKKCGWWIDIGSLPLINALQDFLSKSEDDLKQMGQNGIRLVMEKYTADAMGRQMVDLYNKVILNS